MIIQLFLTAVLGAVALVVAQQRATSRIVRALMLTVIGVGVTFVWVPEATNRIAEALGVGRGADLMLYLWVVITLGVILLLYLKIIRMGRQITELARALALSHPVQPDRATHDR